MGRLKKKNKLSLPCDQDIGSSAIAIFAIHTCYASVSPDDSVCLDESVGLYGSVCLDVSILSR